MTWIIAQGTVFGQVLALSDIQVTITDQYGRKTYKDCLQKMYAMDQNIIAGFAGNVYGGFAMLSSLSKYLKVPDRSEREVWEPKYVIDNWSTYAKVTYDHKLTDNEKTDGIHLLIAGVSHTEDMGIPGMGKPYIAVLKSPEFKPEYKTIGDWASVGSGSYVQEYKEILDNLTHDKTFELMKMEVQNPGGYATVLSITLLLDVQKEAEQKGISKHFHIAIASRNGIKGGNSDHSEGIGDNESKIIMPNVARSLYEFKQYIESEFGKAESIHAIA